MSFRGTAALLGLAAAAWFAACQTENPGPSPHSGPSGEAVRSKIASSAANSTLARSVTIELGQFVAGTRPGRFPRDPEIEPSSFTAKLGEFEIDTLPYPGDPNRPALLGTSREEASRLCGEQGGRLCTELEWERACAGPKNDPFAGGEAWQRECGPSCASGFGVRGLGWYPEWTASDFGEGSPVAGNAVLKGPSNDAAAPDDRRCAHRGRMGAKPPGNIAFRCCRGAPNAARVSEPPDGPVFSKRPFEGAQLKQLLEAHPKTKPLAAELSLFAEPEAVRTVLSRGSNDDQGFDFTTTPLLWQPTRGARFLIVTAKSGKDTSFVLAYHVIGDDEYSLASSFVMHDEPGPIALAFSPSIRPRLHWSNCWSCPGENGKILFKKPDSVVILQP